LLTAAAEAKTERHGNDLSDEAGDTDYGSEFSTKKSQIHLEIPKNDHLGKDMFTAGQRDPVVSHTAVTHSKVKSQTSCAGFVLVTSYPPFASNTEYHGVPSVHDPDSR
jgi:hypothetical protein